MNVPARWLSIDPGDNYVGLAHWVGIECVQTAELSPEGLYGTLTRMLGIPRWNHGTCEWELQGQREIDAVVSERWALYAWNEASLAGNEFITCQVIGTIKTLCRLSGCEHVKQWASQGKSTYKRAPFKQWGAKQWRKALGGPIGRGHTRDALAHGVEFLRVRGVPLDTLASSLLS